MDFNETAVFVRVVQAGSFSVAARQLGIPTSTVSTRISRLEKRLGITLLQRTTRKLHLTEAGTAYFHHASLGLGYMMEAEAAVDEARQQPQGKLKVTAPADLGDNLLAGLVAQAQKEFPSLEIELILTDRYIDLVADGIDVAIRTGTLRDSSLIAKSLGKISWALFASPAYLKQALQINEPLDLQSHHCLQFTPLGRDAWDLSNGQTHLTIPLPGRAMANSIGVVKSMAMNHQGIALLPTFVCKSDQRDALVQVLPDWQGKEDLVHLVYPRQRFMSPKLRAFIDLAQLELRAAFDRVG